MTPLLDYVKEAVAWKPGRQPSREKWLDGRKARRLCWWINQPEWWAGWPDAPKTSGGITENGLVYFEGLKVYPNGRVVPSGQRHYFLHPSRPAWERKLRSRNGKKRYEGTRQAGKGSRAWQRFERWMWEEAAASLDPIEA